MEGTWLFNYTDVPIDVSEVFHSHLRYFEVNKNHTENNNKLIAKIVWKTGVSSLNRKEWRGGGFNITYVT